MAPKCNNKKAQPPETTSLTWILHSFLGCCAGLYVTVVATILSKIYLYIYSIDSPTLHYIDIV